MPGLLRRNNQSWTEVITPQKKWFELKLKEVWEYRDLIILFVRRDFLTVYKQTVLGPLWHFIQPVLTTLIFTVVFGRIAGIGTDGVPPFLFYLCGIITWNYFAKVLTSTSTTFIQNAAIFGKVYFPRITVPVSLVISSLLSFGIQMILFLTVYFYYFLKGQVQPNYLLFMMPMLLIVMGIQGLGAGIIISSLTTKYRDLSFLVTFGVQLLMYLSPVIYPSSILSDKLKMLMYCNPIAHIIEAFRYGFLGTGNVDWSGLVYSGFFALFIFLLGLSLFNRVEKTFMDTV